MFLLTLITLLDYKNGPLLDELMEEYGDKLYSMTYSHLRVYGKESHEEAEDLVQDTFLRVYLQIERFKGLSSDETIKLLVVYNRNVVYNFIKKKENKLKKVPLVYEEDDEEKIIDIPDEQLTPEELIIDKEAIINFADLVDRLPEAQRDVMILFQHGYKNKKIAKVLHITESNVSTRILRAKKALRMMMEGEHE